MKFDRNKINGYGLAGFLLSVAATILTFVRFDVDLNDSREWIVWALVCVASVCSAIGIFRKPRLLAYFGLAICLGLVCASYLFSVSNFY